MTKMIARNASLIVWDSTGTCRSISGYVNNATLSSTAETPDVTSFGDTDRAYLTGGLKDWTLDFDGFYTTGASLIDETLNGIYAGSTYFKFYPAGSTSASPVYTACAILSKYDLKFAVAEAAGISATLKNRSGSLTRANE